MALPTRGIVTPEAVVLEFETAGIGSRGICRFVDFLIQGALIVGVVLLAATMPDLAGVITAIVGVALAFLGYPIVCEVLMQGRSPGKATMGLRAVTIEGAPISARHAFIRSIVGIVDFLVPPGGLFAVGTCLLTARDQRLGDLAAGTIVVRERTAKAPAAAVWFTPPPGLEAYTAGLDVSSVSDAQFGLVRTFLLRVADLSPQARYSLAVRLADPLTALLRTQPPPGVAPETFLVCVAAAHQRRHHPVPPPPPPTFASGMVPPPPPAPSW
jgi:uncharacterized RDD family membrane protein YckC